MDKEALKNEAIELINDFASSFQPDADNKSFGLTLSEVKPLAKVSIEKTIKALLETKGLIQETAVYMPTSIELIEKQISHYRKLYQEIDNQ